MNLVTGASGLLGMHIVAELISKGQPVKALVRPNSDLSFIKSVFNFYGIENELSKVEFVEGDVLDTDSLLAVIQEGDVIYHSAAVVSYHSADRKLMYATNVKGTANVVNAALENKAARVLQISSIAALKRKFDGLVSEEGDWENNDLNTHYGITKHLSELEIWRGIQEGIDGVILNPGLIIGPADFSRSSSSIFSKINEGFSFYPPGGTGFVGVKDVAKLAVLVAEKGKSGDRYVAVSENLSMKELFQDIAHELGVKVPSKEAKPWMLQAARIAEWLKEKFTGKKALVTHETVKNASIRFHYSNQKVKDAFEFEFSPVHDSIVETASFFRKQHS
ncbi:MAG: NAD-dependent epimerase/dehydratase family protein [Flavobacteriales bacterium]